MKFGIRIDRKHSYELSTKLFLLANMVTVRTFAVIDVCDKCIVRICN
jgi:hypothetical protein